MWKEFRSVVFFFGGFILVSVVVFTLMGIWLEFGRWAVLGLLVLGCLVLAAVYFGYGDKRYVLINPSEEQILAIYKGNPAKGVYLKDAHQVKGEGSLVEVSLNARTRKARDIPDFLDGVGVKYQAVED